MTSPIPEEDSYDGHLARRLIRAAATAVSHEECRQLAGEDPTGGHGFYAAGIVAAQAVLRALSEATPPANEHVVDVDFGVLADLIAAQAARVADRGVCRDRRPWRVGSHYGIHVYAVNGDDRDDEPIATAQSAKAAQQIVAEHNVRHPETTP
jgi:hypothetical protein